MNRNALASLLLVIAAASPAAAQTNASSAGLLHVIVTDPSGAVIPGARVRLVPAQGEATDAVADAAGDAAFALLAPGRYTLHVESDGFEPRDVRDVRVRSGVNRRDVRMAIAKLAENVLVTQDPRERNTDPRGNAFSSVLTPEQIAQLPDDPDEMEAALRQMGGPGAQLRVNGFRGGRLPPKDQISSIRFRRNGFSAENHDPGFISVDITTRPGLSSWRGGTTFGFRDDSMNARNVFAPRRGPEQQQRYGFSLDGPLWRNHTSLSLNIDGLGSYDSQTIVAARPEGAFSDVVRRPNDRLNVSSRVEHALGKAHTLRGEYQQSDVQLDNLGVGNFDLSERAYARTDRESLLRIGDSGSFGRMLFNEFRFQARRQETTYDSLSQAATIQVLNAFTSGGAQVDGGRRTTDFELADNLDFPRGRHSMRAGFLLEGGWYRSDESRNTTGTFVFSSLDAFNAGQPATFSRRAGDPLVEFSQVQAGVYFQDDIRISKDFTLSLGVRDELQSHVPDVVNIAPRAGFAWSPFKKGSTTFRGGVGLFYDWMEAQTYEQTLRVDGVRQQDLVVRNPGYPDPYAAGGAIVLPPGRIQLASALDQPQVREASFGVQQQFGPGVTLNATYINRRSSRDLRGVNVNAPVDGVRPDPLSGNVTTVESTGRSAVDLLSLHVQYVNPGRISLAASYLFSRSRNEADSPFSLPADNYDPHADWGPSPDDARHRAMGFVTAGVGRGFRVGSSFRVQSALPYNITTGFDTNGDAVFNDRPDGVGRNSARGSMLVDIATRLSWTRAFGTRAPSTGGGPQVRIVRAGPDTDVLGQVGGGMPNPNKRYSVEVYAQAFNVLNRVNATTFSGVETSPFFGRAIAAAPPRRIEVGARFGF
jgi:carboxypeptidase family protein